MPSFHGIHQDCDETVKQLIVQLREQLRNPKVILTSLLILPLLLFALHTLSLILFYSDIFTSTSVFFTLQGCDFIRLLMILTFLTSLFLSIQSTPKQLAECVDLLLQLKEPADELCDEFLAQ